MDSIYWEHFKTIMKHKWEVCKICFKFGLYWQGIIHDLSKFSWSEFGPSARYFQGKYYFEFEEGKIKEDYLGAWLNHKAKNKHHQWYWLNWDEKQNPIPIRIPAKYVYEMIADWIAAGMIYNNQGQTKWSWSEPYEYYKKNLRKSSRGFPIWEFATKAMIDNILVDLKEWGIEIVAQKIRSGIYEFTYYNNLKDSNDNEIFNWIPGYNGMTEKYYEKENRE